MIYAMAGPARDVVANPSTASYASVVESQRYYN